MSVTTKICIKIDNHQLLFKKIKDKLQRRKIIKNKYYD